MTLEHNKALIRRFGEEILNQKNLAAIDDICRPDYVEYDPAPGQGPGAEGLKQWFGQVFVGLPDMHWTIEEQVAEGEHVMSRWTWRGTHLGELFGIPATGKQVTVAAWTSDHIVDGKLADSRIILDMFGMMQQMGIIPAPGQGGS